MSKEFQRKTIEQKLSFKRRSDQAATRLAFENAEFDDWWGKCRYCGERLKGSLAELREHDCGRTD